MPIVTASATAANGLVHIVGTDSGLVIGLAAQKKPTSVKVGVQPCYIATQHARKVTCIAASDNTFITASDDCTILVSQIGCLYGSPDANCAGSMRYRITGAHSLPITALASLPSDSSLIASASADGTVVLHRLRFAATSASSHTVGPSSLPTVGLAQSMEKLIQLPFPIAALAPVRPSDGTLLVAAGIDVTEGASLRVALIDVGVAQRDGNGTGRPLQPFVVLSPPAEGIHAGDLAAQAVVIRCDADSLVVSVNASEKAVRWPMGSLLKAVAIGRAEEDVTGEIVNMSEVVVEADPTVVAFAGSQEQVATVVEAVTNPNAKPNGFFASLYNNFCWSSWSRPSACADPTRATSGAAVAAPAAPAEDSDEEEAAITVSAPGFGKRARKTQARVTRAEADAAGWARLAYAVDTLPAAPAANANTDAAVPYRYSQLLMGRSISACDSPYAYAPFVEATTAAASASTATVGVATADEEEAAAMARLAAQKLRNAAVQSRMDALYAAVTAAAASRKSGKEEAASPKGSGRPAKKHTAEKSASPKGKSVFSLT